MPITGIWDNPYVQNLGILDHCQELIVLYNQLRIEKAKGHTEAVYDLEIAISREKMDLLLILEKSNTDKEGNETIDKKNLRYSRLNRFLQKAKE